MTTLTISLAQLQLFLFVFVRVAAILMTLPVFSGNAVPTQFKIGMAMAVSMVLFPLLPPMAAPAAAGPVALALGLFREVALGAAIGLAVKIFFAGVQLAGQTVGYQMGMAIANVMDPATSVQVPILAQFNNLIAVLIFLIINAHHWFIRALAESFGRIPLAGFNMGPAFFDHLIRLSSEMFVVAVKVGAPVIVALLLTSVALGLVARTVPQMNIFMVAMPLKIIIGLVFMGICLPHMVSFLRQLFHHLYNSVLAIMTLAA
ncbi:MAG: flagellar type III secretion system protein FliR [Desulfobacterales bacterium]|nr:flagellar type III secretion system protein FliR [Desulfobacterales bacterium]